MHQTFMRNPFDLVWLYSGRPFATFMVGAASIAKGVNRPFAERCPWNCHLEKWLT